VYRCIVAPSRIRRREHVELLGRFCSVSNGCVGGVFLVGSDVHGRE